MRTTPRNPVFAGIDRSNLQEARQICQDIAAEVGGIKLGKEFFTAQGPSGLLSVVGENIPLFLDLKFHDIPNTVAGAVRSAATFLKPTMLTIHASGGPAMIRAAADASAEFETARPWILGVTVLTSMDDEDLVATGVSDTASDQVRRLAELARKNGADGVICSPFEIEALRADNGPNFKLVVPGIRPVGSDHGDQKRVKTPIEALNSGADYLVISRPIIDAPSPASAARSIVDSLS
ncbi:MAG: orotidine-5'-phosphate decarboxylase [Sneathiella sp.]